MRTKVTFYMDEPVETEEDQLFQILMSLGGYDIEMEDGLPDPEPILRRGKKKPKKEKR